MCWIEDHLLVLSAEFESILAEQEKLHAQSASAAHYSALRKIQRFLDTPEAPESWSPGPQ